MLALKIIVTILGFIYVFYLGKFIGYSYSNKEYTLVVLSIITSLVMCIFLNIMWLA